MASAPVRHHSGKHVGVEVPDELEGPLPLGGPRQPVQRVDDGRDPRRHLLPQVGEALLRRGRPAQDDELLHAQGRRPLPQRRVQEAVLVIQARQGRLERAQGAVQSHDSGVTELHWKKIGRELRSTCTICT